jgi:hypothetical protein
MEKSWPIDKFNGKVIKSINAIRDRALVTCDDGSTLNVIAQGDYGHECRINVVVDIKEQNAAKTMRDRYRDYCEKHLIMPTDEGYRLWYSKVLNIVSGKSYIPTGSVDTLVVKIDVGEDDVVKDLSEAVELLYMDYDRMSSSGQQTYDKICSLLAKLQEG